MSVTPLELAKVAAVAADDKKATDICLIDVTETSDVCDYFLICSGDNPHLVGAIVNEIEDKVRVNCSEKPLSIEGQGDKRWVLMDYGVLVVNVFNQEDRGYYRLENLWGDSPRVKLDLEGEMDLGLTFESDAQVDED